MGQASLNVAFFFELSAIATQRLKKQTGKQKPNEDHEDISGYDPLYFDQKQLTHQKGVTFLCILDNFQDKTCNKNRENCL